MSVKSYDDLVERLGDIWRILTEWLVIKQPSQTDSNHRRWENTNCGIRLSGSHGTVRQMPGNPAVETEATENRAFDGVNQGAIVSEVAVDSRFVGVFLR